jgi:cholesterol transport system auxiliary component
MNIRSVGGLCLGLLVTVLTLNLGCSLNKPYPAKLSFLIEAKRPGEAGQSGKGSVLQVRSLQVAAPFEGKAFVHRLDDLQYEVDFYHEFLVAPRVLLTQQVREWLAACGLFQNVLDPTSKAEATLDLEGNVAALYADFRDKKSPKAVLEMEFFLVSEEAAVQKVSFHQSYRKEVTVEGSEPASLAKGWSTALGQILTALEQDLAKQPAK